jgi:transposase
LKREEGLEIYSGRMKIEEAFRDLKGLLGMERVMNKTQENMEKMIALLLIVYAISFLVGENLRDYLSGYHDLVSRIDLLQEASPFS